MFIEDLIGAQVERFLKRVEPKCMSVSASKCRTHGGEVTWFGVVAYANNKSAAFYLRDFSIESINSGFCIDCKPMEFKWQEFLARRFGQDYIFALKDNISANAKAQQAAEAPVTEDKEVKLDEEGGFTYHNEEERKARQTQSEINAIKDQIQYLSGQGNKYSNLSAISGLKGMLFDLENGQTR